MLRVDLLLLVLGAAGPGAPLLAPRCPARCTTATATIFNGRSNEAIRHHAAKQASLLPEGGTHKIYGCTDAEACAFAAALSANESLARAGFVFWDLQDEARAAEAGLNQTPACLGWRSIQRPKGALIARALTCCRTVAVVDAGYAVTPATFALFDQLGSRLEVLAPRDASAEQHHVAPAGRHGMGLLNVGRVVLRSTPETLQAVTMARRREELWDQEAFNIAFRAAGVRCCAVDESLAFEPLTERPEVGGADGPAPGRRPHWSGGQGRACGLPTTNATGPRCTGCSYHKFLDRNMRGELALTAKGLTVRRLRKKKSAPDSPAVGASWPLRAFYGLVAWMFPQDPEARRGPRGRGGA